MTICRGCCALFLGLAMTGMVRAADAEPTAPSQWIEQLDAPGFSQRQEASRKLSAAGREIFPQLERVAETGSREVASRAVEILKRHFIAGDEATKESAKSSLERLAKSGNPAAAQRAGDALSPPREQEIPLGGIGGINPAMVPAFQRAARQRGVQIQIGGLGRNIVNRTSIRNVNGKREIEVQAGEKTTKVREGANGGLEVEITEQVNGKETTRKIDAKDLNELKQKEPAAAEIYERYSRPAAVAGPDVFKRQLESIDQMIERNKAQLPGNPNIQRSIDSLERLKQQIEQNIKDSEKPAAEKP